MSAITAAVKFISGMMTKAKLSRNALKFTVRKQHPLLIFTAIKALWLMLMPGQKLIR
jgi:hypothetical protein